MEMSLSILVLLAPFFFPTLAGSGTVSFSSVAEVSWRLVLGVVSAVSSSSVLVKIWLGLLNFFLGAFPLQPGQRHLPRGV